VTFCKNNECRRRKDAPEMLLFMGRSRGSHKAEQRPCEGREEGKGLLKATTQPQPTASALLVRSSCPSQICWATVPNSISICTSYRFGAQCCMGMGTVALGSAPAFLGDSTLPNLSLGGERKSENINGLVAGRGDVHSTIDLHTSERIRYSIGKKVSCCSAGTSKCKLGTR
jgi:hypothetical protein